MTAYEDLSCAIVETAIKDYRKALRKLKANTDDVLAENEAKILEEFFLSDWFETLSLYDGETIIDTICEQELFDGK